MTRFLRLSLAIALSGAWLTAQDGPRFDEHFLDRTMRVDFLQTGDAETVGFSIDQVYEEGEWAGNPARPIDPSGEGMYSVKLVDIASNRLIYSRGFATLFGEYRTTTAAKQGLKRSFHQSARVPFPKRPVLFVIEERDDHNLLVPAFRVRIDPADVNIVREAPHPDVKTRDLAVGGAPHQQVDLALVAEGYAAVDEEKFWRDAERIAGVIFEHEPFGRLRAQISIRAVYFPSADSGVDQPRKGVFCNTAVDAAFNALDLERYLLIDDNKALRDIAAAVPYDLVVVLANSSRYGGGGIYNDYCISTVDHARSEFVVMHEFGHAFGNLADEYFESEVAYNEFYPPGIEPHEPNITALLDPQNVKWQALLTPGIPVPTPWGQDEIEELRRRSVALEEELQARIAAGGAEEEIRALRDEHRARVAALRTEEQRIRRHYQELYAGKVGVFEGAGYSPRGLYRSEVHVGMLYEGTYGPVSEAALAAWVEHLTGRRR